jgi:Mg/Co/Ni transporter MgtE
MRAFLFDGYAKNIMKKGETMAPNLIPMRMRVKVSKHEISVGCILHYCLTIVIMLTMMWILESGVESLLNWSFNSR